MSRASRASRTSGPPAARRAAWTRRGRAGLFALALAVLPGWTPFRTVDPDVEAGNRAYAEGRYDDALAAYDRAGRRGGVDAAGLAFDRGTAGLKKADAVKDPTEKRRLTERALEDLQQAGRSKDNHVRGAASYNRGNALLAQDKLADAIEAYKQALRDDAQLDDARLNLELALRRRQQQQSQGGQGHGQQGQGQQGQGQQGQGQQGQGQQGQGSDANPQDGSSDGSAAPQSGSNSAGGSNQQDDAQNGASRGGGSAQSQPGSNGEGSDAQGSNQPADRNGQPGRPQPKRPPRSRPQAPKTPSDRKLDDLDDNSRRLQRDGARKRATGHAADPQHDW